MIPETDLCQICTKEKDKTWHLVCSTCWSKLPKDLREELYQAFMLEYASKKHIKLIHKCLEYLRNKD